MVGPPGSRVLAILRPGCVGRFSNPDRDAIGLAPSVARAFPDARGARLAPWP